MRYTSEYVEVMENSIVIGKDDDFYKGLDFSESDIELIRKQEIDSKREGGIDYVSYVLNLDRALARVCIPRVKTLGLGVLPEEIEYLIKLVTRAGDIGLPVYLILEKGFEFAGKIGIYEALLYGINPIKFYREGYDIDTIDVICTLLVKGIDITDNISKETVLDRRILDIILDYADKGKDFSNILKYNMEPNQVRLMELLDKAEVEYDIEDCLQNWNALQLGVIEDSLYNGNNVMPYINSNMNYQCIEQADYAMTNGYDVELVTKYNLSRECMATINCLMEDGIDIKGLLEEGFTGAQAVELALGLKEGLDITSFKNLRYTVMTMRNLRLIALEDKQGLALGELSRNQDNYNGIMIDGSEYESVNAFSSMYDVYCESEVYQAFEDNFKIKLD